MDRCRQIICLPGFSCICIKHCRNKKFLSQFVFLRKYTVIGKYFQICNFYLVIILTCFFIYDFFDTLNSVSDTEFFCV